MGESTGILLVNLGTPQDTGFWSMRRYLKEFLSDKRVVEAKGPVWWLILNAIILVRRPKKSGRAYAKIWNKQLNESPLRTITREQTRKISEYYKNSHRIKLDWAMRYGEPSIADGIERLWELGCRRFLVFPLYPQYSAATTASAMDKVFDKLKTMRWQPLLRSVPPYFEHPLYIEALTRSVKTHLDNLSWTPEVILASFHGLPIKHISGGDPYQSHCEKTTELLRAALNMDQDKLMLTYQSRSNRGVWLGPDTEETLTELAHKGIRKVLVITPGFAADCIETLEEIEIRAADAFRHEGGQEFSFVACLNDSRDSIEMLIRLINRQLVGWTKDGANLSDNEAEVQSNVFSLSINGHEQPNKDTGSMYLG
ncbi:MAG: ferrochelatase [Hyphomicrobiales bacterium]|nr:ferrochelatase [Hyphomicrobiales bacterium]